MANLGRHVSPIAVTLASLLLWGSFAWALPVDTEASEGEAEPAAEDPWAGVKISDAYDYAKCPRCGHKNDIRAERCSGVTWRVFGGDTRCGYEFPQPSAEYTYPPWVFVPGLGYYREGTLIEPARTKKRLWVTGLVLTGSAATTVILLASFEAGGAPAMVFIGLGCLAATAVGVPLLIYGLIARTKPVYAFADGEPFESYKRPGIALRSPDSDGVAFKVEVTALGF